MALTFLHFSKVNETLAILYSKVFDSSPSNFSLNNLLNSDSINVGNTFKALRKLLCSKEGLEGRVSTEKNEEDCEMIDETKEKNGSKTQIFVDDIEKNLSELMTKFVAAYK